MKPTLLWLDDLRDPFVGDWTLEKTREWRDPNSVVWVKTFDEFVRWIERNGMPHSVSFDHDLGEVDERTGADAARWLVERCLDLNSRIPEWTIHSANPIGRANIDSIMNSGVKVSNMS